VCGLHGFAFGALYAPAQALMFGFDFKQMLVWISAGLPFDAIHGVANICAGLLVVPLVELLRTLLKIGATQK
jgi:energy-coupling factor transport system substrate-specific component